MNFQHQHQFLLKHKKTNGLFRYFYLTLRFCMCVCFFGMNFSKCFFCHQGEPLLFVLSINMSKQAKEIFEQDEQHT